jgi:hypothetical protein
MEFAGMDNKLSAGYFVNNAVFVRNAPRPITGKIVLERFRLACAMLLSQAELLRRK